MKSWGKACAFFFLVKLARARLRELPPHHPVSSHTGVWKLAHSYLFLFKLIPSKPFFRHLQTACQIHFKWCRNLFFCIKHLPTLLIMFIKQMPMDYCLRAVYIRERFFFPSAWSMVENGEVLLSELFLIPRLIYTLALIGRTMMISLIMSAGECKCFL